MRAYPQILFFVQTLTIPVRGIGGDRILKLPSRQFNALPENEYSMMELARAVGIDVPRAGLTKVDSIENLPHGIETSGTHAFVIDRFDRTTDRNLVHIEDFAQVFGVYPDDKYDKASIRNIASVIGVEGQQADIEELIRRLVFNVLIGNADMHLKNWSLIYHDKQNASLAPAYDFVSTIFYIPDESFALKFSRTKRFAKFSQNELSHLANKARLPEKLVLVQCPYYNKDYVEISFKVFLARPTFRRISSTDLVQIKGLGFSL